MNQDMKNHVMRAMVQNMRFDGRNRESLRDVTIELGVSKTAEGSAKVTIGKTIVIAGVKLGLEKPYPDTPDQGNLMIGAELLPIASSEFEMGPPDAKAIELARVIDRAIRESKAIDVKDLVLKEGELVWSVMCDICPLNDAGNLFDCASLAAAAALFDARFPTVTDGVVDYKKKTDTPLPLTKVPLAVTVWKVGDNLFVDPSAVEEKVIDARLTVGSTDDGMVCALQKGGQGPLVAEEIDQMLTLAIAKGNELREHLQNVMRG